MAEVNNNNSGGMWASWNLLDSKKALGEQHEARVERMGGRELLDELEATDHQEARRKMNPWFQANEANINKQKALQQEAADQRTVNAVQSKMKVDERETAKSQKLHSFQDSFQFSQPVSEPMSLSKMTAAMAAMRGTA